MTSIRRGKMVQVLYHYSDRDDISIFEPRAPLKHPHAEPLVYAIDEWHSPLYFFPRDCPRIAIWPIETSSQEDVAWFQSATDKRILEFIGEGYESAWRDEPLYRYEFDPADGFVDTGDHGVWVSRQVVVPKRLVMLDDLPGEAGLANVEVRIVSSLLDTACQFFDFEGQRFTTSLHVSMIRTSSIPTWPIPVTKPRFGG